ncbi:MAG: hypothetical protein RPT25_09485 [Cycloclasticus sp.]
MIRSTESKRVYKAFMAGEVINKTIPNDSKSELVENTLYNALVTEQMNYETLYQNIGYKLSALDEAFYLQGLSNEDSRDPAMEVQVIIEALSIGMLKNHVPKGRFTEYSAGLPTGLIERCMADDEITDLLHNCNIKDGLDKAIQNKLIARKLAFKNAHGRLVLSAGGKAIFDAIYQ